MIRRRAALAGLGASAWGGARAAERKATLLVGATPGSRLDKTTRAIVPFLNRRWAQVELVPRNLPGEGGMTALAALADSLPSGATLGWVATPTLSARIVDRDGAALPRRLILIGAVTREPVAFVSPPSAPVESVRDLLRRAGEDADAVPLGTPPPGSPPHLAVLRLQAVTQTRLTVVTFPSAAAARQAVLGGHVSAAALGLSDTIGPLRSGRLLGIGLAARNRFGMLPDMPVLVEAGVPLAASIRRGIAAPAGLPEEMAARIAEILREMVADPAFRGHADEAGFVPIWTEGRAWARIMETERTDLARMWTTEPWMASQGG